MFNLLDISLLYLWMLCVLWRARLEMTQCTALSSSYFRIVRSPESNAH